MKRLLYLMGLLLPIYCFIACSEDETPIVEAPSNNYIEGQTDRGVRNLTLTIPRMGLTEKLFEKVNCYIHIKGVKDRITYPINTFLSATEDSLTISAEDPILSELPHQKYYFNYVTFPSLDFIGSRTDEVKQDTLYLGAIMTMEDPNRIAITSTMNVQENKIGSGTEDDPYTIAYGQDFIEKVCDPMTTGEDHTGKFYALTNDISLLTFYYANNQGWEPAGHNAIAENKGDASYTKFNGTIDGNGHTISGITHNNPESDYAGLFYWLGREAYIHDLKLDIRITGRKHLGGLACQADKGSRLEDISVYGYINGAQYLGGLVAEGSPTLTRCMVDISISAIDGIEHVLGTGGAGGMIGYAGTTQIDNCIFRGIIDMPTSGDIGGLVGARSTISFNKCLVYGKIAGGDENTGGFAGNVTISNFTDCIAGATIAANNYNPETQAFFDILNIDTSIMDAECTVSGEENVGGFIGYGFEIHLFGNNQYRYENNTGVYHVTGTENVGGFIGWAIDVYLEAGSAATSVAQVKGEYYVGGLVGDGEIHGSGSLTNKGTLVEGRSSVGGILGSSDVKGNPELYNFARVKGSRLVGGIAGGCEAGSGETIRMLVVNEGNVEGTGESVGGLFGSFGGQGQVDFLEGSRVGHEGGSLTIKGGSAKTGGLMGSVGRFDVVNIPPCYANISGCADVGGLIGLMHNESFGHQEETCEIFKEPYECHAIITSTKGDAVGGIIGRLVATQAFLLSNVVFKGSITANGDCVGGILGYLDESTWLDDSSIYEDMNNQKISNCHNYGTITTASGKSCVGGIIGKAKIKSLVQLCSNHGEVKVSGGSQVGGIVGRFSGPKAVAKQCYNAGTVQGKSSTGGIVGYAYSNQTIQDCYNTGKTTKGGIVGYHEANDKRTLKLTRCYNIGSTDKGILGSCENKKYVDTTGCYYLSSKSDGDCSGIGTHKVSSESDMYAQSTYAGYSTNIWLFHEGESAPTLKNNQ